MSKRTARAPVERHEHSRKPQNGGEMHGMESMASKVTHHYDEPAPQSRPPAIEPFPRAVMWGLALGATLGGGTGLLVGYLLINNILVMPGWELMYSGAAATIYALWAFIGVALGVASIGIIPLFAIEAKPSRDYAKPEPEVRWPAESKVHMHERSVGEP